MNDDNKDFFDQLDAIPRVYDVSKEETYRKALQTILTTIKHHEKGVVLDVMWSLSEQEQLMKETPKPSLLKVNRADNWYCS